MVERLLKLKKNHGDLEVKTYQTFSDGIYDGYYSVENIKRFEISGRSYQPDEEFILICRPEYK